MKIYVGNLAYAVTDEDLRQAFSAFGAVNSAEVVKDMYTRQSKGFGFIEMAAKQEADNAINSLNGADLKGRKINVNEARPRTDQRSGGGSSRGGYGGGGRHSGGRSW